MQGTLRLVLSTDVPSTRSADENAVHDIHLLVYDASHQLLKKAYFSSPASSVANQVLLIRIGSGYTVYGIANTGNESLFSNVSAINTEDELKAFTTDALSSWDAIGNGEYLLMSGSVSGVSVSASSTDPVNPSSTCNLSLKRLVAKVMLNVGIASGSGITISGYRVYGLPRKSYYVAHPLSTEENETDTQIMRAQDASLPANASDWAYSGQISLSDVTSFDTTFYMYENRAGVNADIHTQNQKVKANVPGTPADSATYVEIYGNAPGYISLSWKIYLGANNTTNFNIKRNCTYTCTVTLKPNDSDIRVNYNKLIWAGSNIYWDAVNQRLTFDAAPADPINPTEQELSNMKKQGVCFKWGSLVGVSLSDTYVTYTPIYNSSNPTESLWTSATGTSSDFTSIAYFTYNVADGGQANTFLNDAAQNADVNYVAYKGDICQYLSKTQPSLGSWRMPTAKEYNAGGVADNTDILWSTSTIPWAYFGSFDDQTNDVNAQGTFALSSVGIYTVNGSSSSYPASGYRKTDGTLLRVGQFGLYWSSSTDTGSTNGYVLYFNSSHVYPAVVSNREYGYLVRCVQN